MRTPKINQAFVCLQCGKRVAAHQHGSCRNHCPYCLYSLHVDAKLPGDRLSTCQGLMRSIVLEKHSKKGYMLVHKCEKCGAQTKNKLAPDDDFEEVLKVASNQ